VADLRPLLLLLLVALAAGCSVEEPRLEVAADGCWGHADCSAGLATVRAALGADLGPAGSKAAVTATGCGPVVDCDGAVAATDSDPASEPATPRETPASDPASDPRPKEPSEATPPAADATPEPVASAGGCDDVSPGELEKAASLNPSDVLCLGDIARGVTTASDADRQVAAIALYNHKASGWPAAVEAALKRPGLRNAPALNFAGIKPAYDGSRYGAVVSRANVVWRNLDKGYQLSSGDKTFLTEFACRASGQLALAGNAPDAGLDWCERWLARASKAGQDTGPIQDLIDQLE